MGMEKEKEKKKAETRENSHRDGDAHSTPITPID
jgi:hypothetical protein